MRLDRWLVVVALALPACGATETQGEKARAAPEEKPAVTSVELAELEINHSGVDRYTSCPPAGELGQDWIPKVPPWMPPASGAATSDAASDPPRAASTPSDGRTATEKAIFDTYPDFRRCYQRGLLHDPTQDGHAAIVLRVGPDGRVGAIEAYGVCELSQEVVACMKANAAKLRFDPPASGAETITIPAVFTTRGGRRRDAPSPNDAYTASAYVILEEARQDLHACDAAARRRGQQVQASATFLLDIGPSGRVMHVNVDPWQGNQDMLACAAHAIEKLAFDAPPAGRGSILARVTFNPRVGTK